MGVILQVENLVKGFRKVGNVVDGISFELQEGEILGFLGPNGAGKTTTLQMLLGIMTPSSGKISVFGKDLKRFRGEIMEDINFASAYTNFPWPLKVKEVLKYTAFFYDIKDRKGRLSEIKKDFDLDEIWDKKIAVLSAGQLARVNLAKAFINRPRVLLLDEPTSSLDPVVVKMVHELILQRQKKENLSIILTSHNMGEVEDLADRVVFIDKGKIIGNDSPQNLAKKIKNCRVELIISDQDQVTGLKKVCSKMKFKLREDGNMWIVDAVEEMLSDFMAGLQKEKVRFVGISIQKPTLEDYFIEIAHKKFEEKL